ncbi:unnamed protein product [Alopecurus aequalis]
MGQKMASVHQKLSMLDNNGRRHVDGDDDFNPMGKRDSQPARTKTGQQKMALVLSLLDNNFKPMDEERAIVVAQQSMDVDEYLHPPPLRTVRPESLENGQEKWLGFPSKGAKKPRTKRTSPGITYKGKRGRLTESKSAKRNIEQKLVLFDSSGSSSHSTADKNGDFEPPTPNRKRGRPGSKCARRKIERKQLLVDSSSTEVMKGKDDDCEPEVSEDDGGRKKYARVKSAAWKRAVEAQEKLPAEGPSLVKLMLHSHVVKGFWLGLPAIFCRKHLPNHDVKIMLEDEEGQTRDINYLAYKMGLSGGWRGFVEQHDLKVGDAVVFQLVRPTIFKVYILRENRFTTTDGTLGLLSLDTSMEKTTSQKEEESSDEGVKSKEEEAEVVASSSKPSTEDSDNPASEEVAGGGIRSPSPDTGDFVAVKRIVNFKIVIGDGSVISRSVLPDHLRWTYYYLCQAQKALLHRNLLKISPTLATAVIVETANIAEGIRASSSESLEDLGSWKKTLESFKAVGMNVAFMIKRVDDLLGLLGAPSSTMEEPEGYKELKLEWARAAKELEDLELRLTILKDSMKEMDVKMEEMVEANARKKKDQVVRQLATAPW